MVCLGNICRSPLAEGILTTKTFGHGIEVDSAGTSNYHIGSSPDKRSIDVAAQHNINITQQRGRQFQVSDFDDFDHIYAMDSSNKENILKLARTETDKQKVSLILEKVFPGENVDVQDPYYGGLNGFKNVYDMLDEACEVIAKELI